MNESLEHIGSFFLICWGIVLFFLRLFMDIGKTGISTGLGGGHLDQTTTNHFLD